MAATFRIRHRLEPILSAAASSWMTYSLVVILSLLLVPPIRAWLPNTCRSVRPSPFAINMVSPQQLGSFQTLPFTESHLQERQVLWEDWTSNNNVDKDSDLLVDFEAAWDIQKDYLQQHLDRLDSSNDESLSGFCYSQPYKGVDRIITLEHRPVYTLGTASDPSFILDENSLVPVVRMDRGGEVTYHGPGQLTVYPVIDLRNYQQDIHWYVRALEEAVLVALELCFEKHGRSQLDVEPTRDDSFTGVFVPGHGKIAAIGIKCRRWITQHGAAINVLSQSLPPFQGIVPCGLTGSHAQVTCVNDLVQRPVTVSQMASYMKVALEQVLAVQLVSEKGEQ